MKYPPEFKELQDELNFLLTLSEPDKDEAQETWEAWSNTFHAFRDKWSVDRFYRGFKWSFYIDLDLSSALFLRRGKMDLETYDVTNVYVAWENLIKEALTICDSNIAELTQILNEFQNAPNYSEIVLEMLTKYPKRPDLSESHQAHLDWEEERFELNMYLYKPKHFTKNTQWGGYYHIDEELYLYIFWGGTFLRFFCATLDIRVEWKKFVAKAQAKIQKKLAKYIRQKEQWEFLNVATA